MTLDPATLTPEAIVAMAAARGLRLIPLCYIRRNDEGQMIGCCAAGALALSLDPEAVERDEYVPAILYSHGIGHGFRNGLQEGFDGRVNRWVPARWGSDVHGAGYALGRATRRLAGLDESPAGGGGAA